MTSFFDWSLYDNKQDLHRVLLAVRKDVESGKFPNSGLCSAIITKALDLDIRTIEYQHIIGLCSKWPEGTGSVIYPVTVSGDGYLEYFNSDPIEKWSKAFTYGAKRRRLLDWLIEQTKPEG